MAKYLKKKTIFTCFWLLKFNENTSKQTDKILFPQAFSQYYCAHTSQISEGSDKQEACRPI